MHCFRRGGAQHRYFNWTIGLNVRIWKLDEVLGWGGLTVSINVQGGETGSICRIT
jgi:hypothetical protein